MATPAFYHGSRTRLIGSTSEPRTSFSTFPRHVTHGDDPIQNPFEQLQHLFERLADSLLVGNIALDGLERLPLELLLEGFGDLDGVVRGSVEHGDVASSLCDGPGQGEPDTTVTAGHDKVLIQGGGL